jgi:energy-coupling factor transporter ATP-binding protein EcfA2
MTTTAATKATSASVAPPPTAVPVLAPDPLARCLAAGLDAAEAADLLGLDSGPLRAAHAAGTRRIGFPGEAYVLALVGGTGVGKSSLLNALAGLEVSPASARRPTTAEPIAWIPRTERDELAPLLEWLDVRATVEHEATGLGPVAILDLPDMDSVATEHRARVEALLPLVDAVAWVADPEKYADAVLHDEFLGSWLPRLDRQVVVVNKADRLAPDAARRVERDLRDHLASGIVRGSEVMVLRSSAVAADGLKDLRAWIAAGAEAKHVVRGRIAASVSAAVRELAWQAGEGRTSWERQLLGDDARETAIRSAIDAVFRAVDLPGVSRQAVAATQAAARSRGTGPLGRVTSFVYRASGRQTAVADPQRFLLRWRERGGLSPAVEAIRDALTGPIRDAPPALRPAIAATLEPAAARSGLERALDQAIGEVGSLDAPTSRWWSVIGFLQTLATLGLILSAAWVVVWILVRPPTGSVSLPVLGPIPTPFVALVAFLLAGYVLARLLGWHARWLGRRWGVQVRDRVAASIGGEIRSRAFRRLDALEVARRRLATAASDIERSCGGWSQR